VVSVPVETAMVIMPVSSCIVGITTLPLSLLDNYSQPLHHVRP
jgi:hypothetical protein